MKVALIGYGKMGQAIAALLPARGHEVVATFDREGIDPAQLQKAEVAIEFTRPEAAVTNLNCCFEAGVPVVSGTTGWLQHYAEVEALCRSLGGALFYAANFSLGVNLFFALNRRLAALMADFPDYQLRLEEIHHTEKKDKPSGTAIRLAEEIQECNPLFRGWTLDEVPEADQIPIAALRKPDVPGTHTVKYISEIDEIDIRHTAHSRKGFALGAIKAAEFLAGKTGIYTMQDLLQL